MKRLTEYWLILENIIKNSISLWNWHCDLIWQYFPRHCCSRFIFTSYQIFHWNSRAEVTTSTSKWVWWNRRFACLFCTPHSLRWLGMKWCENTYAVPQITTSMNYKRIEIGITAFLISFYWIKIIHICYKLVLNPRHSDMEKNILVSES